MRQPRKICRLLVLLFISVPTIVCGTDSAEGISYDDGQVTIQLSDDVESAVNSGVPLTFVFEFAVVREFLFIQWPEQIETHKFVVKRHDLSSLYLVNDETNLAPKLFRSMTDTMAFLSERAVTLFSRYHTANKPYRMRVRLSKYELPGPLRLNAFVAGDWELNTGWREWQFAQ